MMNRREVLTGMAAVALVSPAVVPEPDFPSTAIRVLWPSGGDDQAQIMQAIRQCIHGGVVQFAPGIFHLSDTIMLTGRDIRLCGSGATLKWSLPDGRVNFAGGGGYVILENFCFDFSDSELLSIG